VLPRGFVARELHRVRLWKSSLTVRIEGGRLGRLLGLKH
jgi:hypothetical protein